jgi:phosphopantothenoylcysteine decarboxylase/phosphopantothenate--cysteine ligase
LLMQDGHAVQAVMTRAAQEFISPLTFAALTGRKTLTDLFAIESAIEHIAVAQENELMAIAPATADLVARLAHGLADDFLTTLYLAFTGPVVLAPSMNSNMWLHAATQANLETLRRRGHRIVEPESGYLACRPHPGAARPGALHLQPFQRQDGLCAGRSRRRPGCARHSDLGSGASCAPARRRGDSRAHGRRDAPEGVG